VGGSIGPEAQMFNVAARSGQPPSIANRPHKGETMSRAWINFYMGDYQKKTSYLTTLEHGAYFLLLQECWTNGKIPMEPSRRATIAKLTLKEWNRIAPIIDAFFEEDGTNRRATEEITKSEITQLRREVSAQKAGRASGLARRVEASRRAKYGPSVHPPPDVTFNGRSTIVATDVQRRSNADEPNHNQEDNLLASEQGSDRKESGKVSASPELINSMKNRGFLR
jgi:uncharacterized protein YdaU (DUF1376 family)